MTRIEIKSLVDRFIESPDDITTEESELLYDSCANYGQQLDNIKSTKLIIDLVERFLKDES